MSPIERQLHQAQHALDQAAKEPVHNDIAQAWTQRAIAHALVALALATAFPPVPVDTRPDAL
jgi:hypothetical protein